VKKEGGRFVPTEVGMVVTDLLLGSFEDIFDVTYTARMEEELDEIEAGKLNWREAMGEFYEKFEADLTRAEREMRDVKRQEIPTEFTCEKCARPMVIKWGRHGSFLACSGYPECTNTREIPGNGSGEGLSEQDDEQYCDNCGRPMVLKRGRFGQFYACTGYPDCKTTKPLTRSAEKKPDVPLNEPCPQCGGNLVLKSGRFGEFTACSNYPACKYVKQKLVGVKCPQCSEGDLVERRSKRGRAFYGCNRYPDCEFVAWSRPLAEPCPECGSPYLLEKRGKAGTTAQCPAAGCKFKKSLAPAAVPA